MGLSYKVYSSRFGLHTIFNKYKILFIGLVLSLFLFAGMSLKSVFAASTHTVCALGCDYTKLQDAIDNAVSGDTVELNDNLTISSEVSIDKDISVNGNGHTISPTFVGAGANNSAIEIIGISGVTLSNLIVEGSGGTSQHGINVYEASVILDSVTTQNNDKYGLVVNGSIVAISNIVTAGNGWGGIDVDLGTGVTNPATLTIDGASTHTEILADIFVDDTTKPVTVNDTNSQYNHIDIGNARAYKLKPDTQAPQVTFTHPNEGQIVGDTRVAGTIVDNTNVTQYSFEVKGPNSISWNTKKWFPNTDSVNFDHNLCENDRLNQCEEDDLPSGVYEVNRTLAYDGQGNDSRTQPGISFALDKDGPSVSITDPAPNSLVNNVLVDGTIEDQKLSFFNIELSKVGDPNWNFTTQKQHASSGQTLYELIDFDLLDAAYYGTCAGVACASWPDNVDLPNGDYRLRVNAYDEFGNRTIYSPHNFTLDTTAPDVSDVILNSESVNVARDHNCGPTDFNLVNGEINISANITDNLSGVKSAKYKIRKVTDGGCTQASIYQSGTVNMNNSGGDDWITLPGTELDTTLVPTDGNYTIQVTVVDNVGNETTRYVDITVDNTKPATTWDSVGPVVVSEPNPTVTGNSTDNLSGVSKVEVQIEDSSGVVPSFSWTVTGVTAADGTFNETDEDFSFTPASPLSDGTYTFLARATDTAGNIESTAIMTVTVDTTPNPVQNGFSSNSGNNSNSNNNNGNTSTTAFNTTPFNTFGTFGTTAPPPGGGNVLNATDGNNNGNDEENNGEVQANSTGVSSATTAQAAGKSLWSWWWILPIIAALLLLFTLLRRRGDEEET